MDLAAIRNRIADNGPAGIHGHARPPGSIGDFPAYIVHDPVSIVYHRTHGRKRPEITLTVRVLVARTAEEDGSDQLDALVSTLPDDLEQLDPDGLWMATNGLVVESLGGGYFDWSQGGQLVALGADLTIRIDT